MLIYKMVERLSRIIPNLFPSLQPFHTWEIVEAHSQRLTTQLITKSHPTNLVAMIHSYLALSLQIS